MPIFLILRQQKPPLQEVAFRYYKLRFITRLSGSNVLKAVLSSLIPMKITSPFSPSKNFITTLEILTCFVLSINLINIYASFFTFRFRSLDLLRIENFPSLFPITLDTAQLLECQLKLTIIGLGIVRADLVFQMNY